MKYALLTVLALCLMPAYAMAQATQTYVPFPLDFEKLDAAKKQEVLKTVDENTDKYFRSREYGMALNKFVADNNPANIKTCDNLSMNKDPAKNKITVDEPLLFAKADDMHPTVGKWEQIVSFEGCQKIYDFTISATGNKGALPNLVLKAE